MEAALHKIKEALVYDKIENKPPSNNSICMILT